MDEECCDMRTIQVLAIRMPWVMSMLKTMLVVWLGMFADSLYKMRML